MKSAKAWCAAAILLAVATFTAPPGAAQELRPAELNVQFHRAETAWRSGTSMLEAKARVDRVLQALPDDVAALKLRAQVLLGMDRPDEAHEDILRAVALSPDDGEAYLILSETARVVGETHLAEEALVQAAERVLDDAGFHIRLSWNAALLGQLDKAEAYGRIALALDGNEAAAYYQLARVFIQQEHMDAAASILARGLRNAVVDPTAIRRDTLLLRVADHETIRSLLR